MEECEVESMALEEAYVVKGDLEEVEEGSVKEG